MAARRRALALMAVAAVLVLAVEPVGPLAFGWAHLLIGVAVLGGAVAAGPRGGLWAAGLTLVLWGLGVSLVDAGLVPVAEVPVAELGLGLGALLAAVAPRAGVDVGHAGLLVVAVTIVAVGTLELLARQVGGPFVWGLTYGAALAAYGLWDLAKARPGAVRASDREAVP